MIILNKYLRKDILLAFLAISISACSTSNHENIDFDEDSISNLTNNELMAIYGSAVRHDYRNKTDSVSENRSLLKIEEEVESRDLIKDNSFSDIEKGLVYLYMPVHQAFASIDGLDVEENADFENFVVSIYRGNPRNRKWGLQNMFWDTVFFPKGLAKLADRSSSKNRETILVCKNKLGGGEQVIGYRVWGTYTFEKFRIRSRSVQKIITNPEPGHFDVNSPESMKYLKAGRTPPGEPRKMSTSAAGGSRAMLLKVSKGTGFAGSRLRNYFDETTASGGYASMLKYLENVC